MRLRTGPRKALPAQCPRCKALALAAGASPIQFPKITDMMEGADRDLLAWNFYTTPRDTIQMDWVGRMTCLSKSTVKGISALAAEIDQMQKRELPAGCDRDLPQFAADPKGVTGRDASGQVLNVLARNIPWLLGGSADLGPSNKTTLKFDGAGESTAATPLGRNLHFGVREHAMADDRERNVAVEAAPVRRNVLHLQRLCPGAPFACRR